MICNKLTGDPENKTLDKRIKSKYYMRYNIEKYIVFIYWKKFKIRAIDLDNKLDIDY